MSDALHIRDATSDDIDAIIAITRKGNVRKALPWVMKVTLVEDINQAAHGSQRHKLLVAVIDGKIVGFTRFLHRMRPEKDGRYQTTGHETAVDPDYQGVGVGTRLAQARLENTLAYADGRQDYIQFLAPVDIEGNKFHRSRGFNVVRTEISPKGREMNVYQCDLAPLRAHEPSQKIASAEGRGR